MLRIGLFSRSNLCFSLFFPEKQGNRTDADPGRDGGLKVGVKVQETAASSLVGDGMARPSPPNPRLWGEAL